MTLSRHWLGVHVTSRRPPNLLPDVAESTSNHRSLPPNCGSTIKKWRIIQVPMSHFIGGARINLGGQYSFRYSSCAKNGLTINIRTKWTHSDTGIGVVDGAKNDHRHSSHTACSDGAWQVRRLSQTGWARGKSRLSYPDCRGVKAAHRTSPPPHRRVQDISARGLDNPQA